MSPSGATPGILASTDHIKPTITITNPTGGSVAGTITLQANAADNDHVASVQFKIDGNNIGAPVTAAPFQIAYNTGNSVNGAHTFSAVVTDRIGNNATASVGVTVANAPGVNFYSPGNGATVTDTITLTAAITNYGTSVTVQFFIDGNQIGGNQSGGSGTYQANYDTHMTGVGWHTFLCKATDAQGNVSQASNSYYVNNQPPGSGMTVLGDHEYWDDGSASWSNYRHSPPSSDDTVDGNWIWSGTGTKWNPVYLPGNPNPTYYQMRVWLHLDRVEGGSDGNVCYMDLQVGGVTGWTNVWANGPAYTNVGPLWNVGGGNDCYAHWYCSRPDWNTCFCLGIGFYYDFVPKYSS